MTLLGIFIIVLGLFFVYLLFIGKSRKFFETLLGPL